MPQAALVIGAVATVAGTVMSYNAQKKAAKAQEKQQQVSTRRSQRQAIREAQLARASALSAGSQFGALGGSAVEGGVGAVGSQLGSGLGYSTQMSSLSRDISKYSSRAAMWGDVAQLGGMAMNYGYSRGATFGNLFSTANKAPTSPSSFAPMTSVRPVPRPNI